MSFKTPLDHQVIVTSFTCKKGGGDKKGGDKKKGGDVKRGAPLHVVEGSRVFWIKGLKIRSTTSGWWIYWSRTPTFPLHSSGHRIFHSDSIAAQYFNKLVSSENFKDNLITGKSLKRRF